MNQKQCFKRQVARVKHYIISEVIKKENSEWTSYYEIKDTINNSIAKKPLAISPLLLGLLDYNFTSKDIFQMVDELKTEKQYEKTEKEDEYDL